MKRLLTLFFVFLTTMAAFAQIKTYSDIEARTFVIGLDSYFFGASGSLDFSTAGTSFQARKETNIIWPTFSSSERRFICSSTHWRQASFPATELPMIGFTCASISWGIGRNPASVLRFQHQQVSSTSSAISFFIFQSWFYFLFNVSA